MVLVLLGLFWWIAAAFKLLGKSTLSWWEVVVFPVLLVIAIVGVIALAPILLVLAVLGMFGGFLWVVSR